MGHFPFIFLKQQTKEKLLEYTRGTGKLSFTGHKGEQCSSTTYLQSREALYTFVFWHTLKIEC